MGAFREAIGVSRQALVLSRELQNSFLEAISQYNLAYPLSSTGDHVAAPVALSRSRGSFIKQNQYAGVAVAYIANHFLGLGDPTKAVKWAENAWQSAGRFRNERDFIRAALMQGQAALGTHNLPRADERLHHALTRARAVNMVEFELPALIAIARLKFEQGQPAEAKARLDEVWEAAERGPYPLHQADAYNVLAAIALSEGDKPAAIAAATKAYKAAWCDGPPYAYHWGLK
jgi:tetratricopeptide (TPR) repeat protein